MVVVPSTVKSPTIWVLASILTKLLLESNSKSPEVVVILLSFNSKSSIFNLATPANSPAVSVIKLDCFITFPVKSEKRDNLFIVLEAGPVTSPDPDAAHWLVFPVPVKVRTSPEDPPTKGNWTSLFLIFNPSVESKIHISFVEGIVGEPVYSTSPLPPAPNSVSNPASFFIYNFLSVNAYMLTFPAAGVIPNANSFVSITAGPIMLFPSIPIGPSIDLLPSR